MLSDFLVKHANHKSHKRLGRGIGCTKGKTAGKGHKGQTARSGCSRKRGFEGGQQPLVRALPKRGFKPLSRYYSRSIINLGDLQDYIDRHEIPAEKIVRFTTYIFIQIGILPTRGLAELKLLGGGTLNRRCVVQVSKVSAGAMKVLKELGCEVIFNE